MVALLINFPFSERNAAMAKEEIKLPAPKLSGTMSVEEAIRQRRSERNFLSKELTLAEISQLFFALQGITALKSIW